MAISHLIFRKFRKSISMRNNFSNSKREIILHRNSLENRLPIVLWISCFPIRKILLFIEIVFFYDCAHIMRWSTFTNHQRFFFIFSIDLIFSFFLYSPYIQLFWCYKCYTEVKRTFYEYFLYDSMYYDILKIR